ncbi:MAG: CDP-diacylglycerol--serine O-phosphatidyltransferase [Betaproteobacteria bacterium]|nr:CDP-diacylglycerol--serine O-phosphatidyltransferase [Betaproteobacteria bacterium]
MNSADGQQPAAQPNQKPERERRGKDRRVGTILRQRRQQGSIYWLPNLFTTLSLLCGIWATVRTGQGDYSLAASAIFLAAGFDLLDGRVARMTNAESAFGEAYDSLSDAISFGVAPAVLAFFWGMEHLGRLGFAIAFLYCAASVARLARFNISENKAHKYFIGLPSPMAALMVAGYVFEFSRPQGAASALPLAMLVFIVAVTMVSTIKYYSFKNIDLAASVTPKQMTIALLVFTALALALLEFKVGAMLAIGCIYLASGYLFFIRRTRRYLKIARRRKRQITLAKLLRNLFLRI